MPNVVTNFNGPTDIAGGWPDGERGYTVSAPKILDPKRCKALYRSAYVCRQCYEEIWKDGYCKNHYNRREYLIK